MAGNPFRRPAPNPPPPFFPLAMSGDGEFEGNSAGLTFLNQLNFTIDVSPSPIGIQFAFSALISLIAESTAGIGVYSYATNAITILDTNNHNTIFNFSPSEISPSITANGGDVSTLNFVDSFEFRPITLPVGDYEIIVGPAGATGTIPEPSSLWLLSSGLLILIFTVRRVFGGMAKAPYPLA